MGKVDETPGSGVVSLGLGVCKGAHRKLTRVLGGHTGLRNLCFKDSDSQTFSYTNESAAGPPAHRTRPTPLGARVLLPCRGAVMFPTLRVRLARILAAPRSLPVCRFPGCVDGVGPRSPREETFIEEKEKKPEQQLLEYTEGEGI